MSEQNGNTIDDTMKSGSKKTGAEKAQSAVNKFNKAKKNINRIRSIKSLAWLTSLIGTIGSILLVVFLIIGAIGFLVTLPGLAIEKFTEACKNLWRNIIGDTSIQIEGTQINDLADYIQNLGYDLVGYGFINSNSIDKDGNINLENVEAPVEVAEIDDLLGNKKELNVNSDTILKGDDTNYNEGTIVFPSDVMSDANIIRVEKDGNVKYYKAVDKDGKNISFYDENGDEIKYEVKMNNGTPYLEKTNGKSPIDSGNQTTDGYRYSKIGISFDDYKKIMLKNVNAGKYGENINKLPKLDNQANYISRVVISLRKAVEEKSIEETDSMREFREYINQQCNKNYSSFSDMGDNIGFDLISKCKEKIQDDNETYAIIWLRFGDEISKISSNLKDNQINIESKYYTKKQNLYAYVLSNERTYITQGADANILVNGTKLFSVFGILPSIATRLDSALKSVFYNDIDFKHYGMLVFDENDKNGPIRAKYSVEVDRETNEMKITTNNNGTSILDFFFKERDQMKWDLSGWTSRYGKPIELSLTLHLSTMAPDFVYDFCADKNLQTKINLSADHITYNLNYEYHTTEGKTITDTDIKNAMKEINVKKISDINNIFNVDNTTIEQYAGEQYQFNWGSDSDAFNQVTPPYEILAETSIVRVDFGSTNGDTKFYKVLDKNGNPLSFFNDPVTPANHSYIIGFNGDNLYFEEVKFQNGDNEKKDRVTFDQLFSKNQCNTPKAVTVNGKELTIKLEVLSINDVAHMINSITSVATNLTGENYGSQMDKMEEVYKKARKIIGKNINNESLSEEETFGYLNGEKYRRVFKAWDEIINKDEEGILSEKYRKRAKNLELDLYLNLYQYNFDKDNGTLTVEKIDFNSEEGKEHKSAEAWDNFTKWLSKQLSDDNFNYNAFEILNYKRQDTLINKVYNELQQVKTKEIKENANGYKYSDDENYLKLLAIFSDSIDKKLNEWGIDYATFFKLYYVFRDLKTSVETYRPYIKSVTNHWYKDIHFDKTEDKNDVYSMEKITNSSMKKFNPEGIANSEYIKDLNNEKNGQIWYKESTDDEMRIQKYQPRIVKTETWHYMVKNWIVYGYYFIYDGQQATAKKIERAMAVLKDKYDLTNPLLIEVTDQEGLYKGNISPVEIDNKANELNKILQDNGIDVKLQKINFEKKSSLAAFSILEAMHTEDSEYIYRDLKEFLIELGYFTRADFESVETDVFKWIIQGYTVYKDEWPDIKYEKNKNEYGTYIRSAKSLEQQRKDEGKEYKETHGLTGVNTYYDASDDAAKAGYQSITTVNGITYKNYKQFLGSYAGYYYWGNSDPNNIGSNSTADSNSMTGSGCGPTTAAVVLSGYGIDKGPWDVAQIMIKSCKGITNGTDLKNAMNSLGCKAEHYSIDGNKGIEEAKSNIKKALLAGKPVLAVTNTASGGYHYVTLLGIDSDENVIISDVGNVNNNYKGTVEDFVEKLMGNCSYIIPEKAPSGITTNQEVVGFESGKNVIMPETGKIIKIGNRDEDSKKEKNENKTNNAQENKEKDYFATNGDYIRIEFNTGNGVNGWTMEIEGLTIDANIQEKDELNKGDTIGTTNEENMKIILYDNNNAIINNVEDYFKLQARKKNSSGTGDLEELGVMILTMEGGMDSYSEGDYWKVIEDSYHKGDKMCYTAGGSGVTNWCEQEFKDTGHDDLYPMELGALVPKQAILEVKAKVTENRYNAVKSKLQELGVTDWTETQILAFTSATYNGAWGDFVDVIKEYKDGDKDKAKWMFLGIYNANGKEAPGLKYRRAVEWDIFENGAKFEYTEERKQECYRKYYTNFYYTHSY